VLSIDFRSNEETKQQKTSLQFQSLNSRKQSSIKNLKNNYNRILEIMFKVVIEKVRN
jgi:hypothetical protein